jgi:hypothetical protein
MLSRAIPIIPITLTNMAEWIDEAKQENFENVKPEQLLVAPDCNYYSIISNPSNAVKYMKIANYFLNSKPQECIRLAEDINFLLIIRALILQNVPNITTQAVKVLHSATNISLRNLPMCFSMKELLLPLRQGVKKQTIIRTVIHLVTYVADNCIIIENNIKAWKKHISVIKIILDELDLLHPMDLEANRNILTCLDAILMKIPKGNPIKHPVVNAVCKNLLKYRATKTGYKLANMFATLYRISPTSVHGFLFPQFFTTLISDPDGVKVNYHTRRLFIVITDAIFSTGPSTLPNDDTLQHIMKLTKEMLTIHPYFIFKLLDIYNSLMHTIKLQLIDSEDFTLRLVSYITDPSLAIPILNIFEMYLANLHIHIPTIINLNTCGVLQWACSNISNQSLVALMKKMISLAQQTAHVCVNPVNDVFNMLIPDNFNSVIIDFLNKHHTGDHYLILQTVRKIGQVIRIIQASQGMSATEFMRRFDSRLDMQAQITGIRNLEISALYRYHDIEEIGLILQMSTSRTHYREHLQYFIHDTRANFVRHFLRREHEVPSQAVFNVFPSCMKYRNITQYYHRDNPISSHLCLIDIPEVAQTNKINLRIEVTNLPPKGVAHVMVREYIVKIMQPQVLQSKHESILTPLTRFYFHTLYSLHCEYGNIIDTIQLSKEMRARFSHPEESIYLWSPSVEFVCLYPKCFDFLVRLYAYKMRNMPAYFRLCTYVNRYVHDDPVIHPITCVNLIVNRSNILSDGCMVLYNLCNNHKPVSIYFETELGIGGSPTHEFYNIFADHFFDYISISYRENGYFPHPTTLKRDMVILGILLARVLYSDITIGVRLHPLFFKLMRNTEEQVTDDILNTRMQNVDPSMFNILEELVKDHETIFMYPGRHCIPLESKYPPSIIGDDDESRKRYCFLIKSFTCGVHYARNLSEAFREGFESVFPNQKLPYNLKFGLKQLFDMFSDEECVIVFSGIGELFTEKDLTMIKFAGEYNKNSIQIIWFKNILRKWDINRKRALLRYVTALNSLPYNGLAGLDPPFIVSSVKGSDNHYPTSHTCFHALELPKYSSEIVMEKRLSDAIYVETFEML